MIGTPHPDEPNSAWVFIPAAVLGILIILFCFIMLGLQTCNIYPHHEARAALDEVSK